MRPRLLLLTPLAGLLVLASGGHAAPTKDPQLKDPVGDAVGGQAATDIVSALLTTAGNGTGKSYRPKKSIVTLTLAAPPLTEPLVNYEVEVNTDSCGDITFTASNGTPYQSITGINGWVHWGSCLVDDSSSELLTVQTKGNSLIWTFSLKGVPMEVGDLFENFRARVDPANPVVPYPSRSTATERGLVDAAVSDTRWTLG